MVNIHPDVSKWQAPVDDSFNRRFLMFRALTEFGAIDPVAAANLTWCVKARAAGKIDNFGFYVIPGFVTNSTILRGLDAINLPGDCVGMVDWETWSGKLKGNHSADNNDLATRIRNRQSGRPDLAWGYSNRGDLAGWADRPSWLGMIIAGYNSNDPRDEGIGNVIGWQYTNGTENHTANPSSTPPFGRCDHNVMFIDYPKPTAGGGLVSTEYDQLKAQISALHDQLDAKADARAAEVERLVRIPINGNDTFPSVYQTVAVLSGQVKALQTAVGQLSGGGAVNMAAIEAAAEAGATAAVAKLTITVKDNA